MKKKKSTPAAAKKANVAATSPAKKTAGASAKKAAKRKKSTAGKAVANSGKSAGRKPATGPSGGSAADQEERRKRARAVIRKLKQLFPVAECALHHESAYQLLVATILSAQCTDERVNKSTPELFRRYPDAPALAAADIEDVERIVKPLGFFRNKAKNIKAMATQLVEEFDGEIPLDIDQMVTLAGVGRKTASVVLGTWYGIPSGVVVDTHVRRISNLLGLTTSQNPDIIERELMEILPRKEWIEYSHRIIYHGRATCIARRPQCTACGLLKHCPRAGLPPLEQD